MATAKFDDGLPSNPKIIAAGATAAWLWLCSVLYCRRGLTDGLIPRIVVPTLVIGLKSPFVHAAKLVDVRLWESDGQDFRVHDFLDWNPSKADVESYRAQDRERKQSKHQGHQESVRNPNGIPTASERIPDDSAYARKAHAGGKSASVSASALEVLSEREKSPRETSLALAPVWRQGPDSRASALVGNHRGCFDAPVACARGICVPGWLGQQWRQQLADDPHADGTIRAFVEAELQRVPPGPIGDEPKRFWAAAWAARHGSQAQAMPIAHGKGNQSLAAMQRVIEQRAKERGE